MEQGFRNKRIVYLRSTANRLLESDGLVNAQVQWNKSCVDRTGKPGKASDASEFTLQWENCGYRIVRVAGDRLF